MATEKWSLTITVSCKYRSWLASTHVKQTLAFSELLVSNT